MVDKWSIKPSLAEKLDDILKYVADKDGFTTEQIVSHFDFNATTIKRYFRQLTDVRIATQVVADALRKNCDISIVVSADSNMIPAMELAMEEGHPVFAYFPPFQRSSAIGSKFTNVIRMERYE